MQLTDSPTEYTATYAKKVASIQDAFVFVMSHLDKLGNDPQVVITPVWVCDDICDMTGDHETVRQFEVAVTGMVELPEMV
jgi:hypothetical protein